MPPRVLTNMTCPLSGAAAPPATYFSKHAASSSSRRGRPRASRPDRACWKGTARRRLRPGAQVGGVPPGVTVRRGPDVDLAGVWAADLIGHHITGFHRRAGGDPGDRRHAGTVGPVGPVTSTTSSPNGRRRRAKGGGPGAGCGRGAALVGEVADEAAVPVQGQERLPDAAPFAVAPPCWKVPRSFQCAPWSVLRHSCRWVWETSAGHTLPASSRVPRGTCPGDGQLEEVGLEEVGPGGGRGRSPRP